ncbi:MAG: hypothetical protein ACRD0P_07625 [Stackebrandtia sp.]
MTGGPTRNVTGIVLAAVFLAIAAFLVYLGISRDGWWLLALIPAFVVGMLGTVGLVQDAPKRLRDAKGHPVKD